MQKLLTFFFSKTISVYAIFKDQSFNDTLTNDVVSFEQLGPGCQCAYLFFRNTLNKMINYKTVRI